MFLFSLLQSASAAPGNHLTNVTGLNGGSTNLCRQLSVRGKTLDD